MSRFTILLGGDLVVTERLRGQVAETRVIAADSGIDHADRLGLSPELWTGDFDSVTEAMRARWTHVPVEPFPADKDLTDGEIAVDAAIARGATDLVLAGAFGGARTDHAFLHLAAALRIAEAGTRVLLTSGVQEGVPLLPGTLDADCPEGTLFSVLGFSELRGLTVSGAKWPLDAATVPFGSSLTVSNRVEGKLRVQLVSGRALLVVHLDPAGGN